MSCSNNYLPHDGNRDLIILLAHSKNKTAVNTMTIITAIKYIFILSCFPQLFFSCLVSRLPVLLLYSPCKFTQTGNLLWQEGHWIKLTSCLDPIAEAALHSYLSAVHEPPKWKCLQSPSSLTLFLSLSLALSPSLFLSLTHSLCLSLSLSGLRYACAHMLRVKWTGMNVS